MKLDDALPEARSRQQFKAVLALREIVLSGDIGPGERVAEIALAERLGVSRTPLRLALGELAHEGLLQTLPTGGFIVRDFSPADIADAIDLRGVLEGTAARFAAERHDGDLDALRAAADAMEPLARGQGFWEFKAYVRLNQEFHDALLALADSDMLARSLAQVTALPFASASAFVQAQASLAESREILLIAQAQHRAVVDAIAGREGARAEALMREHAKVAQRNLRIAIKNKDFSEIPGGKLIRKEALLF
jgi:GntR family transcriptional regulator of vanillate catabolism